MSGFDFHVLIKEEILAPLHLRRSPFVTTTAGTSAQRLCDNQHGGTTAFQRGRNAPRSPLYTRETASPSRCAATLPWERRCKIWKLKIAIQICSPKQGSSCKALFVVFCPLVIKSLAALPHSTQLGFGVRHDLPIRHLGNATSYLNLCHFKVIPSITSEVLHDAKYCCSDI